MKISAALLSLLCVFCSSTWAETIERQLVDSVWKMDRQTGMGKVQTLWLFMQDGSGIAHQKIYSNNRIDTLSHAFTYSTEANRVIVQEEVPEEWLGEFGVTRWTLVNGRLIHDVRFRNKDVFFIPVKL